VSGIVQDFETPLEMNRALDASVGRML